MFSKIFPWAFFFNWMPYPKRFWFLGKNFVFLYGYYFERYTQAVIQYHKNELLNLDHRYRMDQWGQELVRRREIAQEQGIEPLDPDYQVLEDVTGPIQFDDAYRRSEGL